MKRCHFNSWVANTFLFPSYKAITLLYNSFFKYRRNECYPEDINHECIHQIQQIECSIIGLFYLWYGIEYLIILCFAKWNKQNERYHDVSFEEEAHNNDKDLDYLEDRKPFAWFKYIKLRSYKK